MKWKLISYSFNLAYRGHLKAYNFENVLEIETQIGSYANKLEI